MDEKKPKEVPAAEKAKEPVAVVPEWGGRKNKTLIIIGIIVIALVLQAIVILFIMKSVMPAAPHVAASDDAAADTVGERAAASLTSMGETTAETPIEVLVNIAGTNGERFVKAAVVLEYVDREAAKKSGKEKKEGAGKASPLGEAIMLRMPKYKSQLIEIISKMTLPEITTPQAKTKIRQELLGLINSSLPRKLGEVKDVYFTQFIIQ